MFILLGKANRQRCLLQRQPRKAKKQKRHKTERAKSKKTLTDKITPHKLKDKTFNRGSNITLEAGSNSNDKYGFMAERERTKRVNSTNVADRTSLGRAFHNRKARLIKLLIPSLVLERGGITPRVAACLVEPSAGDSRLHTAGAL